jgi:hypothetical protein
MSAEFHSRHQHMQERMAAISLTVSYGPEKTEAWSPAWANLGGLERIASALPMPVERCRGGMKVLGSYVGTDAYTKQRAMESVTDKKDRAFAHVCVALTLFAQAGLEHSKNVANMLLNKCVVTKLTTCWSRSRHTSRRTLQRSAIASSRPPSSPSTTSRRSSGTWRRRGSSCPLR